MAKPISKSEEISLLRKEVLELSVSARTYEDWLLEHTTSSNWDIVKDNYNDTLFKLNQKNEKLATLVTGVRDFPNTYSLPRTMQHVPK